MSMVVHADTRMRMAMLMVVHADTRMRMVMLMVVYACRHTDEDGHVDGCCACRHTDEDGSHINAPKRLPPYSLIHHIFESNPSVARIIARLIVGFSFDTYEDWSVFRRGFRPESCECTLFEANSNAAV